MSRGKSATDRKERRLLFFAAVFITTIVSVFDWLIARDIVNAFRTSRFVAVDARVQHSAVHRPSGRKQRVYRPDIHYEYQVNKRTFRGTNFALGMWADLPDEQAAQAMAESYVLGQSITAYYNAADPSEAVLHPGMNKRGVFALIFAALFVLPHNFMALGLWLKAAKEVVPIEPGAMVLKRAYRAVSIGAFALSLLSLGFLVHLAFSMPHEKMTIGWVFLVAIYGVIWVVFHRVRKRC